MPPADSDDPRDSVVTTGPVPIAVRDHGGDGPPVLLLHGSGGNLAHVGSLAELLRATHHVVSMDFRAHGHSGDGPWEWDAVLTDVAAVIDALDLGTPAVVGMSLGGMVAALWARDHPECPAAVNLDGHTTPTRPEQIPGLDPEQVAADLARLDETFSRMAGVLSRPLDAVQVNAVRDAQRAAAAAHGDREDTWIEGFERGTVTDGQVTHLRPGPATVAELRTAQATVDLTPAYRTARGPLLVVLSTEDMPQQQAFHDLYSAYRAAVADALAACAKENPNLHVTALDGLSHNMLAEDPARVAACITEFLGTTAAN